VQTSRGGSSPASRLPANQILLFVSSVSAMAFRQRRFAQFLYFRFLLGSIDKPLVQPGGLIRYASRTLPRSILLHSKFSCTLCYAVLSATSADEQVRRGCHAMRHRSHRACINDSCCILAIALLQYIFHHMCFSVSVRVVACQRVQARLSPRSHLEMVVAVVSAVAIVT
jgi:hypothetical protein